MNSSDTHRSPQSISEAVERARAKYAQPDAPLVFGDDVDAGVAELAPDACPPEKILEHLNALAALALALRRGSLGMTQTMWLEAHGVVASRESESVRTSAKAMQRRTWHDGLERRTFELHTKPSRATHPDRCVRIYFDWDAGRGVVAIGWIGRHP